MSRGPLEVLRAAQFSAHGYCNVCAGWMASENGETRHAHSKDCAYVEAIAQVEALVEAARMASATLGHAYHTTLTGQLAEYAHSDYQKLDAALSPFPPPPGQDSEGGGHD